MKCGMMNLLATHPPACLAILTAVIYLSRKSAWWPSAALGIRMGKDKGAGAGGKAAAAKAKSEAAAVAAAKEKGVEMMECRHILVEKHSKVRSSCLSDNMLPARSIL
eukprot:768778-Hanusia_phi.AAC.1